MRLFTLVALLAFLFAPLVRADEPAAEPAPEPVAVVEPEPVAVAPEPARPAAPAAATKENPDFVKGELSSLGSMKLETHDTRLGLRAGVSKIGQVFYLTGSLEFDLRAGGFMMGLAAPIQIPLWDPTRGAKGFLPQGIAVRKEDYDEASEIMRVVRFITYGHKEDSLYVNLGTETSATIGHGAAIRRYVANVDVDRGKVSAEVDAYGKYGGGELFVGNVLQPQNLVGAIGFLKPFGSSDNLLAQRMSFGLTYAADLAAPTALARDINGRPQLTAGTSQLPMVKTSQAAQIIGLSVETKLVKTESADVKPYLELSQLVGGGAGVSVGGLGRFTFGNHIRHAFRAIGELRAFQGNYLPGYFDTFYEVQRYQYITGKADPINNVPKLADVLARPADVKLGYYLEAQYAMVDWFAVTLAWEDSNTKGGRNVVVHAEVPANETLRFFVSAHRRAVEGRLLDIGREPVSQQISADNTLFFAGARLRVLPILYVNARAFRAWKMDPQPQTFRNVDGFMLDVELGYEFARGDADKS